MNNRLTYAQQQAAKKTDVFFAKLTIAFTVAVVTGVFYLVIQQLNK